MQKDKVDEEDLTNISNEKELKEKKKKREEELFTQQSLMQKVANYMSSRFDAEEDDAVDFASFFLGYYTTKKIIKEGETDQDQKKSAKILNDKNLTQTEIENENDKERHNIFEIFFI